MGGDNIGDVGTGGSCCVLVGLGLVRLGPGADPGCSQFFSPLLPGSRRGSVRLPALLAACPSQYTTYNPASPGVGDAGPVPSRSRRLFPESRKRARGAGRGRREFPGIPGLE